MSKENQFQLKVNLSDTHSQYFFDLKDHLHFANNTELVRYLIYEVWKREIDQEVHYFNIHHQKSKDIKLILSRKEIMSKYNIYSVQEFVDIAVSRFFEDVKGGLKSIFHWDVKSKLSESNREIILAFEECQRKNPNGEVEIETLGRLMGIRNLEKLKDILDTWVLQGYLSSYKTGQRTYYHAE